MKLRGNIQTGYQTEIAGFVTDSGSTNAYAVTLIPSISAYTTGLMVTFKTASTNTGAATLAVNGLTATAIKKQGSTALSSGDLQSGQIVTVIYDGTNFQIIGDGGGASTTTSSIEFIIDGGGSTITTGIKGDLEIPFAATITAATLLADQSGSIVVNIWKNTYANYPPVVGNKITASAPPTISSATKAQDTTLTGWTTSISAGDTLRFNVDSVTTITRVVLSLKITK